MTSNVFFLRASHAAVSVILRCLDLESAWSLVSLIFRCKTLGTAWSTLLELYLRCLGLGNCLEYPPCWCLDLKTAWNLVSVIFRSSTVGKPWGLLGIPSLAERSCVLMWLGRRGSVWRNLDSTAWSGPCGSFRVVCFTYFCFWKVRPDSFSYLTEF